jgi:4-amino-4-deoxy-L-arabinose transferase-like glycosyltransferase
MSSATTLLRPHRVALAFVLAFSAVLELYRLGQNGWANQYYSAAVRSMLGSLHNFFFVSSDPGGLITIDKPPLGLWLQTASAAIFGFHPLSLLVPEAICAVLTIAVLYFIVAPRCGVWAGVGAATALAVFPSFVASTRDNNVDALLLLLMTLACLTGLRAIETGSWRWLLGTAVLIGLAFNTKTLAAYIVVPGLAIGWLVGAPGSRRHRAGLLAGAAVVLLAVSLVWAVAVDLTPATQRPFVGSSTDNSELSLMFGHNGLGRVFGERGAPGHPFFTHHHHHTTTTHATGNQAGTQPTAPRQAALAGAATTTTTRPLNPLVPPPTLRSGGVSSSVGRPGPLRLLDHNTGDQGAWLLPFALLGMVALAIAVWGRGRRDRRLGVLLVMGGWLVAEVIVLSVSTGIVHPYYVSALGPGVGAMVGAGGAAFVELARRRRLALVLPIAALALTMLVAGVLLGREHDYLRLLLPVVIAAAVVAAAGMVLFPGRAGYAMAVGVAAALVIPAIYSATVWQVPVNGTFPVAGPYIQDNQDAYGIPPDDVDSYRTMLAYARPRAPGSTWEVLTQGSNTAAVFILLGGRAAAIGGYGTTDPALTPAALASLVAHGKTRFVALGGGYGSRGGNAASTAVARVCRPVPTPAWRSPFNYGTPQLPVYAYPRGGWNLALYDCLGRTDRLADA